MGFDTVAMLGAALLDQEWHRLAPDAAPVRPEDVEEFERAALERHGVRSDLVPPRYRTGYFAHAFTNGYDAGYYSYLWSEVLDADMVDWFTENGGLTRANGDIFRDRLLSRGGSVDAMAAFALDPGPGGRDRAAAAPAGTARVTVRGTAAGLALAVLGGTLAGCGNDTGSYCDTLAEQKAELRRLSDSADQPAADTLASTGEVLETLRDAAPDDLVDEWETVSFAWQDLEDAVQRAGVPLSELDPDQRPEGVSPEEYAAVTDAAGALAGAEVTDAADGIEQQALDVCGIDLSDGGLGF